MLAVAPRSGQGLKYWVFYTRERSNCTIRVASSTSATLAGSFRRSFPSAPRELILKLRRDDETLRVCYAQLLLFVGKLDAARAEATLLQDLRDGYALYTVACLLAQLEELGIGHVPEPVSLEAKVFESQA